MGARSHRGDGSMRRLDILQATLRLIGQRGCQRISHRMVAEEAGVALGSTTYYFDSRDEMLLEAFRLYMSQFDDRVLRCRERALDDHPADAVAAVVRFLVLLVRDELADRNLLRAECELWQYAASNAQMAGEFGVWMGRMHEGLSAFLAPAGVSEPELAASLLMRLVRGFEFEALIDDRIGHQDLERQLRRALDAFLTPAAV